MCGWLEQIHRAFFEGWLDNEKFEKALRKSGSPLDTEDKFVRFVFPKGCQIKLHAIVKLMALCNQLSIQAKNVTLDFNASYPTYTYLDRLGVFDHLNDGVVVEPTPPKISRANNHQGCANTLFELRAIDRANRNDDIPRQLMKFLVNYTGQEFRLPAGTFLAELHGNVHEHSETIIPGLIAVQCYKNATPPHIQAVISDSGAGIVETLRPILLTNYAELGQRLKNLGCDADAHLIRELFEHGKISRLAQSEDARGLGLHRSGQAASKFNAKVSIRQAKFEVTIRYKKGKIDQFTPMMNMPRFEGTHICFDFELDKCEASV